MILQIANSLKEKRFIQDTKNCIEHRAEAKEIKDIKKNVQDTFLSNSVSL